MTKYKYLKDTKMKMICYLEPNLDGSDKAML